MQYISSPAIVMFINDTKLVSNHQEIQNSGFAVSLEGTLLPWGSLIAPPLGGFQDPPPPARIFVNDPSVNPACFLTSCFLSFIKYFTNPRQRSFVSSALLYCYLPTFGICFHSIPMSGITTLCCQRSSFVLRSLFICV